MEKKLIKKLISELNTNDINFSELTAEGVSVISAFIIAKDNRENMYNMLIDNINSVPIVNIFHKRIIFFKLEEKISHDAYIFLYALELTNPGMTMLYLITLLDYYTEHNKPADMDDLCKIIYPSGFYTLDTCTKIVDKFVKNDLAINGYIY